MAAVLLGAAALAGCTGDRRVGVEGEVRYAGEPIGIGTITFLPESDKGIKAGGRIANGRYKLDPEFGLMPGPHKVLITWAKPTGKKYKNEFGEEFDRTTEGLPDKYHKDSTLTADIKSGSNEVNFNLEK